MSYYVNPEHPDFVYFGESLQADRWIEANIRGAERSPGTAVDVSIPPTEVHPNVFRYLAPVSEGRQWIGDE